jgi:hypothetical protein
LLSVGSIAIWLTIAPSISFLLGEALAVNANSWEGTLTGTTWVLLSGSVLLWVAFINPCGIACGWEVISTSNLSKSLAVNSNAFE